MKSFQNLSTDLAEVVKSLFLFMALVATLFNVAESFEHLVEGHPRNILVYLFQNPSYGSGEEAV